MNKTLISLAIITSISGTATAGKPETVLANCNNFLDRTLLINTAKSIVDGDTYLFSPEGSGEKTPNGGFDLPMWVTVVDNTGAVCEVINTGANSTTDDAGGASLDPTAYVGNVSWLGSRVISAQKANTANAFSLDYYAISTANLFGTVQSNNSLFGLQASNPVDTEKAYEGNPNTFGTNNDPMENERVGGVNVFGGGLALYQGGKKVGAIGVSGDTSCTDHVVAWKIRNALELAGNPYNLGPSTSMFTAAGVGFNLGGSVGDEMYMDVNNIGKSTANGWEHAACPNTPDHTKNGGAIIGNGPVDLVAP